MARMSGWTVQVLACLLGIVFAASLGMSLIIGGKCIELVNQPVLKSDQLILGLYLLMLGTLTLQGACYWIFPLSLFRLSSVIASLYLLIIIWLTLPKLAWEVTRYLTPLPMIYLGTIGFMWWFPEKAAYLVKCDSLEEDDLEESGTPEASTHPV